MKDKVHLLYRATLLGLGEEARSPNMQKKKHRESSKIRKLGNIFQVKKKKNLRGKNLNETEISNFPDKQFKVIVISRSHRAEEYTKWTEKYTRRVQQQTLLDESEERISDLEDRAVTFIQREQKKEEKNLWKWRSLKGHVEQHQADDICLIGVPEGEKREEGRKHIWKNNSCVFHSVTVSTRDSEEITAENFSNLGHKTDIQFQEI